MKKTNKMKLITRCIRVIGSQIKISKMDFEPFIIAKLIIWSDQFVCIIEKPTDTFMQNN